MFMSKKSSFSQGNAAHVRAERSAAVHPEHREQLGRGQPRYTNPNLRGCRRPQVPRHRDHRKGRGWGRRWCCVDSSKLGIVNPDSFYRSLKGGIVNPKNNSFYDSLGERFRNQFQKKGQTLSRNRNCDSFGIGIDTTLDEGDSSSSSSSGCEADFSYEKTFRSSVTIQIEDHPL